MFRNALRTLWAEPRVPQPPRRVWRDWVLVGALLPTAILEGIFRDDLPWRPVAILLAIGTVVALLWRRTAPLEVVAAVFGSLIVLDVVALLTGRGPVGEYMMICVVLLPYSLFRWGSGREIGIGTVFILIALALGLTVDPTGLVDSILGSMFLLFPTTLGAAVRYRTSSRVRELDQVRLREREQLARELHDTVAHHVSAIVIRAQAGRIVAPSDPAAAVDALAIIESEATRTLAEMRVMVAGLRQDEAAAMAPQPGVADLEQLARGSRLPVDVELSGDLDDLGPSVGAALYRIAQESITNAVRHARAATRVDVRVAGEADSVRLTIQDDGEAGSAGPVGYGLVGMTERAALLGGSFEAGPGDDRGWTVKAVLPRTAR
ncbi:sensor histidine kinase [Kribbella sp. NPDC051620]|uniref:sensor histidine kinase n=1 Tax=Kribbella sp. NPDC051620 TaxID=3364120 RepID=UPI0037B53200